MTDNPRREAKTKPRRRARNYLLNVEATLRGIWRTADAFSRPDAVVTPTEMLIIAKEAEWALKQLGYERKAAPSAALLEPGHDQ